MDGFSHFFGTKLRCRTVEYGISNAFTSLQPEFPFSVVIGFGPTLRPFLLTTILKAEVLQTSLPDLGSRFCSPNKDPPRLDSIRAKEN
jgi:hypothetical protein